jgi:transcription attenuation protein (tryptophan RNA-binding attenuator protein)
VDKGGKTMDVNADYILIKALEDGVTIIGLTRGKDTKFNHTEKLDKGEILAAQFTENVSAMKIRGNAEIMSKHGKVNSEG